MKTAVVMIVFLLFAGLCLSAQDAEDKTLEKINQMIMLNQLQDAYQSVNAMVDSAPENPTAWFYKGLIEKQILKQKNSLISFHQADLLNPGNVSVYQQLASGYLDMKNYEMAVAYCDTILLIQPDNLIATIKKAQALQKADLYEPSLEIYLDLHKRDSMNGHIIRQIASLLTKQDSIADAIGWYLFATQIDSGDLRSYQNLGSLFVRSEQYENGIPILTNAIDIHSEDPWLYRFRGSLNIMGAQFDEAEYDFSMAIELGDTSAFNYRHLGLSLFKQSEYPEAMNAYKKTIKLDPEDSQAWFYLAYCFKWQEDLDKALECMQKSLELSVSESIPNVYTGLAEFNALQRNYKEAMSLYHEAWKWNSDDPTPLAQIGMLIEQIGGDKKEAKSYYEQFMKKAGPEQVHLVNYIHNRLKIINERLFMEGELER